MGGGGGGVSGGSRGFFRLKRTPLFVNSTMENMGVFWRKKLMMKRRSASALYYVKYRETCLIRSAWDWLHLALLNIRNALERPKEYCICSGCSRQVLLGCYGE